MKSKFSILSVLIVAMVMLTASTGHSTVKEKKVTHLVRICDEQNNCSPWETVDGPQIIPGMFSRMITFDIEKKGNIDLNQVNRAMLFMECTEWVFDSNGWSQHRTCFYEGGGWPCYQTRPCPYCVESPCFG